MTKNKYPLKLFSIISLAIIALTVIFVSIFGLRTSVEIGGGYQMEVTLSYTNEAGEYTSGRQNAGAYVSQIKKVLSKHNASVDSYFIEDRDVDTLLVVRICSSKIKNDSSVTAEVASTLNIDVSRVSSLQKLGSYFSTKLMLYIGLAIGCILLVCFFGGWLRYNVLAGVSLMFAALHSLILSMALIFLMRVQFSVISLAAVLVSTILVVLGFACILERERENSKSKQYADLTTDERLILASKQSKTLLILPIVCAVTVLVMVCLPIRHIQLGGVSILLSLVSALYTMLLITPALHANLLDLSKVRQKQKLSKNKVTKPKK